ncbi:universal stress protein [Brevibacillus sp. GCM10020057]|uniref:universal stress protein n=1 Tax=Brevibacillus sp. GCM10020057 TaxID=3317327 RepID=UPI00363CB91D
MSRILVPVDFSAQSHQAVRFAAAYATHRHELTILHVIQPFPSRSVVHRLGKENIEKLQVEEAKEDLKPLLQIAEQAGVPYQLELAFGNPHEEIAKRATDDFRAVVMGTHGYGRMTGYLKQSVSYPAIHDAKLPVFLISEETAASEFPWRKALITVDGSEQAMAALKTALQLGEGMDVSYTLLTIVPPPVAYTGMYGVGWEDTATLESWGRETIRPYEEYLEENRVPFESKVLIGDPAMLIRVTAQEEQAGLIVLGHHGLGGIAGTLVGSVTFKTIHRATKPLLIVKA